MFTHSLHSTVCHEVRSPSSLAPLALRALLSPPRLFRLQHFARRALRHALRWLIFIFILSWKYTTKHTTASCEYKWNSSLVQNTIFARNVFSTEAPNLNTRFFRHYQCGGCRVKTHTFLYSTLSVKNCRMHCTVRTVHAFENFIDFTEI